MTRPTGTCADCGDRRWIKTPDGWTRCACYWVNLSASLPPLIRRGEAMLPASRRTAEPWPLENQLVVGSDYQGFRYQVWHSLLHHLDTDCRVRVEVLDTDRLGEIRWGRDDQYASLRQLLTPTVLVLTCGLPMASTAFTLRMSQSVLTMRELAGVPSWVFAVSAADLPTLAIPSIFQRQGAPATSRPAFTPPPTAGTPSPDPPAASPRPPSQTVRIRQALRDVH